MVMLLAITMVAVVAAVQVGERLDEGAQAATAADSAALAGAAEGRERAEAMASANNGSLISYVETSADDDAAVWVTVEVRVGRAVRSARAERTVEWTAPNRVSG